MIPDFKRMHIPYVLEAVSGSLYLEIVLWKEKKIIV